MSDAPAPPTHTNREGYSIGGTAADVARKDAQEAAARSRASAEYHARLEGISADRKARQQVSLAERARRAAHATSTPEVSRPRTPGRSR